MAHLFCFNSIRDLVSVEKGDTNSVCRSISLFGLNSHHSVIGSEKPVFKLNKLCFNEFYSPCRVNIPGTQIKMIFGPK